MNPTVTTSSFSGADAVVIAVAGDLDLATIDRVERPAEEAIAMRRPLVIDLSQCSSIDSTAVRLLLRVYDALTTGGSDVPMALVVGDSPVRRVLSVTGIDERVPLLPTLESAEGWLQLQESELSSIASPLN